MNYQDKWNLIRDILLCVVAVILTIHEAVFHTGPVRVEFLTIYAGMMGIPFVLKADQRRRSKNNGDGEDN